MVGKGQDIRQTKRAGFLGGVERLALALFLVACLGIGGTAFALDTWYMEIGVGGGNGNKGTWMENLEPPVEEDILDGSSGGDSPSTSTKGSYELHLYLQNADDDDYVLSSVRLKSASAGTSVPTDADFAELASEAGAGFYCTRYDVDTVVADDSCVLAVYMGRAHRTICFDPQGGAEGPDAIYAAVGSKIEAPTDQPTRAGYFFAGWYADEECMHPVYDLPEIMPEEDVTYYAGWVPLGDTANVSVVYWGESADGDGYEYLGSVSAGEAVIGEEFTPEPSEERLAEMTANAELYRFERASSITVQEAGNVADVYFARETFTWRFGNDADNGNDAWGSITAKWGENVSARYRELCVAAFGEAALPVAWGAVGSGEAVAVAIPDTMGTENADYCKLAGTAAAGQEPAQPVAHKLTLSGLGAAGIELSVTAGATLASVADAALGKDAAGTAVALEAFVPERPSSVNSHYRFAGWCRNPECSGECVALDGCTMPDADLTLYAKWVPEVYEVAVSADGEIWGETFSVTYGQPIPIEYVPDPLQRDDCEFAGWFYEADDGRLKAFDPSCMTVTCDMRLYPKYNSMKMVPWVVYYRLADGLTDVAKAKRGYALLGSELTFSAKTDGALYERYRNGFAPVGVTKGLFASSDAENAIAFIYIRTNETAYASVCVFGNAVSLPANQSFVFTIRNKETGEVVATASTLGANPVIVKGLLAWETYEVVLDSEWSWRCSPLSSEMEISAQAEGETVEVSFSVGSVRSAYFCGFSSLRSPYGI